MDNYKKQAKLRRELEGNQRKSEHVVSLQEGTVSVKEVKSYSAQYISDRCREIKVYSDTLESIYHLVDTVTERLKILPSIPYQYHDQQMTEFYFQDYCGLEERIRESITKEKWMIFVSKAYEGIRLEVRLNAIGIAAVFLSSETIHKKGAGKAEFERIVYEKTFSCTVLIATAVMDCGVSVVDSTVKHVVLSHCSKTTFLQMVGRKRLKDGEKISLYIKVHSERHTRGLRHHLEIQLRTLIKFALRNQSDLIATHTPTKSSDGMSEIPALQENERIRAIAEIFAPKNASLTYDTAKKAVSNKYTRYNTSRALLLEERECSKTAFAALLYELSNYINALDTYRETKDSLFYLKRQLEWIGKRYDETHWVNHSETKQAVLDFISGYCRKWLNKDEQKVFSIHCTELLLKLPVPPQSLKNCKFRCNPSSEGSLKGPGLKVLNTSLKEKELPYIIKAQQRYLSGKERKTF